MTAPALFSALAAQLLHAVLVMGAAPLAAGFVRTAQARLLGRQGPPVLQPWRDLLRLLRKQPVVPDSASPVFVGGVVVSWLATALAALLVPSFSVQMASAPLADLIVIGGLFGLSRGALALSALDAGTAFGGLGASRDMLVAVFAEPALLLVILVLSLGAGTTNLDIVAASVREGAPGLHISLVLAMVSLAMVGLAENGRLPVGNPVTHLELTMTHEAMVLDHSGRHLALIDHAAQLRLLLWLNLIACLFLPFGLASAASGLLGWVGAAMVWLVKIGGLLSVLAVWETCLAKLRLFRVPEFLGVALLLGVLAALLMFVSQGFA